MFAFKSTIICAVVLLTAVVFCDESASSTTNGVPEEKPTTPVTDDLSELSATATPTNLPDFKKVSQTLSN